MHRQPDTVDLTGMRSRAFGSILFAGAACSVAGLALTLLPAGARSEQIPAPGISASGVDFAPPPNGVPTLVTEVTPQSDPTVSPPSVFEPPVVVSTPATTIAEAVATPVPVVRVLEPAPVSTVAAHVAAPRVSVVVDLPEKSSALVGAMNAARGAEGLEPLSVDGTLAAVALSRATHLVEGGYFAHYGPDGSSAFSELAARGVNYALAGENLARNNYPEPKAVAAAFEGLMGSPGHRANILEPTFTKVGVAAVQDGRMWVFVTVFMS
mgnify:CR=1 FL=1